MRVLFLVSVTGVSIRARKGQIVDMPEDKARTWADGKRAVLVDDQPEPPVSVPPSIEEESDEAETEEVEASEEASFEEEDEEETEEPTPAPKAKRTKQTKKRNKRKR